MPIDINSLRADKGGDPALWREMTVKRCKPASLVDNVIELDEVRGAAIAFARQASHPRPLPAHGSAALLCAPALRARGRRRAPH